MAKSISLLALLALFGVAQLVASSAICAVDQCRYLSCPIGYVCNRNSNCGCAVKCVKGNPAIARACEGFDLKLDCNGKGKIQVVAANYGRTLSNICKGTNDVNTKCNNNAVSLKVLQNACSNKPSCTVKAANNIFGDPCVGTYKYLEVHYYCNW